MAVQRRPASSSPEAKGGAGENQWEQISWDQALDEIAEKLTGLKAEYGAETLALLEGTYRGDQYRPGADFFIFLRNPGNIGCAGTICFCNTAALSYALIGCGQGRPQMENARCVVLHACNLPHTVPLDWRDLKKRLEANETKLIVIDPRKTEAAGMPICGCNSGPAPTQPCSWPGSM